jgi:hypothetical protein
LVAVVVVVVARGVTEFDAAESAPGPAELTARTRKLYAVPLVSDVTVVLRAVGAIALTVRSTVPALLRTWTRYSVIAAPPVLAGAAQFTVAEALPAVAVPMVGAAGAVAVLVAALGVTEFDAADRAPGPAELIARTRKLYAVPLVRPLMVALRAVPGIALSVRRTVPVPLRTCTSYSVMAAPPVLAGAAQLTTAEVFPAVASTLLGAPGAVTVGAAAAGVTVLDGADSGLVPVAFTARTVNLYDVPLLSPVTFRLVAVLAAVRTVPTAAFVAAL